jgi:hypothetical protein
MWAVHFIQELPMDRDRLRRYGLRVVAALSLGVVLVIGAGVANAATSGSDTSSSTVTYIKVVHPGLTTASVPETSWG